MSRVSVVTDEMVEVEVERGFVLTDDLNVPHEYTPSTRKMLKAHATHWYAKAHGVKIIEPDALVAASADGGTSESGAGETSGADVQGGETE